MLNLRTNVKNRANSADKGAGLNKRKIIEKAVVDELCAMLDSGADEKKLDLKKGQPNVVMFVGLQGSGKTTTCSKYGSFYKKKHFKPALVCADTFRAGQMSPTLGSHSCLIGEACKHTWLHSLLVCTLYMHGQLRCPGLKAHKMVQSSLLTRDGLMRHVSCLARLYSPRFQILNGVSLVASEVGQTSSPCL